MQVDMSKPVLLAMNNPLSSDPDDALVPWPERCTGWRLWKMLEEVAGATPEQYVAAFDRRNLVSGREWSAAAGREAAPTVLKELAGRTVLVLGAATIECLKLERHGPGWYAPGPRGVSYGWLPHPSGRCLWYNDPANRRLASMVLASLYQGYLEEAA